MSRFRFMNMWIDNLTFSEAVDRIDELAGGSEPVYVVTPNVDHVVKVEQDPVFRAAYEEASLVLTDGKPLIWIARLYGTPIKEKISGSDLFPRVCERAAKTGRSMFFLGAAEGVAAKAAENLTAKFPGLNVIGVYSPPYGFEKEEAEVQRVIEIVRSASPDILVVGLGTPKQEKFLHKHLKDLNVPVSLGLGASLDFEAGNIRRAPLWMREHGMEWLYRLCKEPRRLFKRYLIDDVKIAGLTLKYWVRKK